MTDETRTRVAVVLGGRSEEHEASVASGRAVLAGVDRDRLDVVAVGVTREGAFVPLPEDFAGSEVPDDEARLLWPDSTASKHLGVRRGDAVESAGRVDVVLPVLRGAPGADGAIQGLFELIGLPATGSGVLAAALAGDRRTSTAVLHAADVPVPPWVALGPSDRLADPAWLRRRVAGLGYPVVVRPARAGSSDGVRRVDGPDDLQSALEHAYGVDDRVLVQRGAIGRRFRVALLGDRTGGAPRIAEPAEVRALGAVEDGPLEPAADVELLVPAPLGDGERLELERLVARVWGVVGARGLLEVGVVLTDEGFVVEDVDTAPPLVEGAAYRRCWSASGIEFGPLLSELVVLAR